MNLTQNDRLNQVTADTLVVGVDIGSQEHFARAFDWRGFEFSKRAFRFSNTQVGFLSFVRWLYELQNKTDTKKIAYCMKYFWHRSAIINGYPETSLVVNVKVWPSCRISFLFLKFLILYSGSLVSSMIGKGYPSFSLTFFIILIFSKCSS